MKKNNITPIFEFTFAAGIMVILALPFAVKAQDHKEFMVNINNSDTTINGKNIKDLSATDRKDALKKLSELNNHISINVDVNDPNIVLGGGRSVTVTDGKDGKKHTYSYRLNSDTHVTPNIVYSMGVDSNDKSMVIARNFSRDNDELVVNGHPMVIGGGGRGLSMVSGSSWGGSRKNSQNFSYSNTDNDGINTRVNFSVSDASETNTKKISGVEKAELMLQDLNLAQSFATGKTTLSFALPAKTAADIEFKDSAGNVIWVGKSTGAEFSKSFTIPKNGIYYLQVKQGGKVALRRISKEE